MLVPFSEKFAVCCEDHTKYLNTLRGENAEILNVKEICRPTHSYYCALRGQFGIHISTSFCSPAPHVLTRIAENITDKRTGGQTRRRVVWTVSRWSRNVSWTDT
jgi:hypothetical protein